MIPSAFPAEIEVEVEDVSSERRGRPARGFLPKVRVIPIAEARVRSSFGKTATITDLSKTKLSDTELVEGFVTKGRIKEYFRWLQDRYVVAVKPFYLWQDASVRGHALLCVMGCCFVTCGGSSGN